MMNEAVCSRMDWEEFSEDEFEQSVEKVIILENGIRVVPIITTVE